MKYSICVLNPGKFGKPKMSKTAGHQIAHHSKFRKDTQYSYAYDYLYKRNRIIQLPVDDTWSGPLVLIQRTGHSHIL